MKQNISCPKCKSKTIVPLSDKERVELKFPSFTLLGYVKCQSCNHAWDIPAPVWVWIIGIIIGTGLIIPVVVSVLKGWPAGGAGILASFGSVVLVGTIRQLIRKKKQ